MDDFVWCPECDDDMEGSQWEAHLRSHGWTRDVGPEITEARVKRMTDERIDLFWEVFETTKGPRLNAFRAARTAALEAHGEGERDE